MVRRVLIADDHEDGREALASYLALAGYEVEHADTGEDALRIASWFAPDVAIVDLYLPGISGFDVANALATGSHRPYLIAISGFAGADTREQARQAGFDYFAAKPWEPRAILELLRALATARCHTDAG